MFFIPASTQRQKNTEKMHPLPQKRSHRVTREDLGERCSWVCGSEVAHGRQHLHSAAEPGGQQLLVHGEVGGALPLHFRRGLS